MITFSRLHYITLIHPKSLFVQALLKMVGSYSTAALSPSRRDALTESPLRIVLFALRKMCDHAICRNFLRSSELLPVIVHLRQSPNLMLSEYENVISTTVSQAPDVSLGRRKFKGVPPWASSCHSGPNLRTICCCSCNVVYGPTGQAS